MNAFILINSEYCKHKPASNAGRTPLLITEVTTATEEYLPFLGSELGSWVVMHSEAAEAEAET